MQNKVPKTYTILTLKLFLCLKFPTVKVKKKNDEKARQVTVLASMPDSLTAELHF